jgi:hypothetical protein
MKSRLAILLVAVACVLIDKSCARADDEKGSSSLDLFVSGTNGYHTYRIPAQIVSPRS